VPLELLTADLLAALAIAVAAGLMRGFAGVGSGMLMAPFFAVLFGPVVTVATIILMEIVVTAQVAGQLAAINEQFSDRVVKNVVSRDRIQELPDNNAAESIGRLPGVAIQRSGGEANKVAIRGLSPKFNTVTVNGVRLPTTDPNDRSVDLSLVSYYQQTVGSLNMTYLISGLVKGVVYGMLVAVAGCLRGMQAGRSALAVGGAATSAVVTGIVWIIAACGVFQFVSYVLGI